VYQVRQCPSHSICEAVRAAHPQAFYALMGYSIPCTCYSCFSKSDVPNLPEANICILIHLPILKNSTGNASSVLGMINSWIKHNYISVKFSKYLSLSHVHQRFFLTFIRDRVIQWFFQTVDKISHKSFKFRQTAWITAKGISSDVDGVVFPEEKMWISTIASDYTSTIASKVQTKSKLWIWHSFKVRWQ